MVRAGFYFILYFRHLSMNTRSADVQSGSQHFGGFPVGGIEFQPAGVCQNDLVFMFTVIVDDVGQGVAREGTGACPPSS